MGRQRFLPGEVCKSVFMETTGFARNPEGLTEVSRGRNRAASLSEGPSRRGGSRVRCHGGAATPVEDEEPRQKSWR